MNMLNIGCGDIYHPDWVNVDVSGGRNVSSLDITNGLPFPDAMFDVVYHSHLLEHIRHEKTLAFMKECLRVLKPGGVIRVLVPDLEQIARLYLEKLYTAREHESDYDWIMLEMYDQCVRETTGGLMESNLRDTPSGLTPFVDSRMGASAALYSEQAKEKPASIKPTWQNCVRVVHLLRLKFAKLIVYAIAGDKGRDAFEEGIFRNSGEIHRWMYDRFSLGRLMENSGFSNIQVVSPFVSSIPGFDCFKLDVIDGVVRKPDSLVMEGVKL